MRRRIRTTPELLALAVSVYFAVTCNLRFWGEILAGHDPSSLATAAFALSTFAALTSIHFLLLCSFSFRAIAKPLLTVLLSVNAAAVYFMQEHGAYLDTSMLRNMLQTDPAEVRDLLSWRMVPVFILYAAVPIVLVWLVELRDDRFLDGLKRKAVMAASAFACLGLCGSAFYGDYASFFGNHHEARYLVTPINYLTSLTRVVLESGDRSGQPRIPVGEDASRGPLLEASPKPVLFVLVVGEAARGSSFSLNGYARETNPLLQNDDVVSFSHVLSCGTSTADVLPAMFTMFGREELAGRNARRYESLLAVMRRAGFRVVWRGNTASCKAVCDGFETEHFDCGAAPALGQDGECFDEVLLTGLDDLLSGTGDLFLVLHQMGSHGPAYFRRYPQQFERFRPACQSPDLGDCSQEEIQNAYDNSIVYTDFLLDRVIAMLRERSSDYDTAMLYVSDHGESTGEGGMYLHGLPYALAPDVQTHVPMILWLSTPFAERFRIDRERLQAQAADAYSHDNLFHSVIGVLDVRTAVYRPERDLFVPSRDERARPVLTPESHSPLVVLSKQKQPGYPGL